MIFDASNFASSVADGVALVQFCDRSPRCADLEIKWNHLAKHYAKLPGFDLRVATVDCTEADNVELCGQQATNYPSIKIWKNGVSHRFDTNSAYGGGVLDMDRLTGFIHKFVGGRCVAVPFH